VELEILLMLMIILLVIIAIVLFSINLSISRQLKQHKDVEDALYKLIEITKVNQKNS
jgi:preprotein translocase subunit YajC